METLKQFKIIITNVAAFFKISVVIETFSKFTKISDTLEASCLSKPSAIHVNPTCFAMLK